VYEGCVLHPTKHLIISLEWGINNLEDNHTIPKTGALNFTRQEANFIEAKKEQ
jgi:hypothetical protein